MVDGLRIDREGSTLTMTVNSDEGNRFSLEMMDALIDEVRAAEGDDATRFVRLRAVGEAFCLGRSKSGESPGEIRAMAIRISAVFETLRTTPLTVLAEINGPAAGFGVGMIGGSDIAVASSAATFAFPEIKAGFAPAVVLSWARYQLPPRLVYDMVSTGEPIDAGRAVAAGLVTEVVEPDALATRVDERIARLEGVDAFALREMKRFLVFTRAMDPGTAAQASVDALVYSGIQVIGKF
jgi:methylglutaconyl-CoA hydratase